MKYTVLGSRGFIGSHLVHWLQSNAISYWAPTRDEDVFTRALGHVIYCVGVTADFRSRPYDTVRAHVCGLLELLERAHFDSFLYLSTTRLYAGVERALEGATLRANPSRSDDLYNISKMLGECLCLSSGRTNIRIARLSNVYGFEFSSDTFLSSVLRDAVGRKHVSLRTSLLSEKDYVHIHDVVQMLPQIAANGRHTIYNVASGVNTPHWQILDMLQHLTTCVVDVAPKASTVSFPPISIERVRQEFLFNPTPILDLLPDLVRECQRRNVVISA